MSHKKLKELAKRRWDSQYKNGRHKKYDIERASLKVFEDCLIECYDNGFRCYYCNRKLQLNAKYPFYLTPSIDHYIPISKGGLDEDYNIVACCYVCNLVKGSLSGDLYEEVIEHLKDAPHYKDIMKGWFNSSLAETIDRKRRSD